MKVHYSKWVSLPMVVIGLFDLALNLVALAVTGSFNLHVIIGAVVTLGGLMFLITPVFALEDDGIALYRPTGAVARRFPFRSRSEIRIDGNRLMVGDQRVPVRTSLLNRSEWRAFTARIAEGATG